MAARWPQATAMAVTIGLTFGAAGLAYGASTPSYTARANATCAQGVRAMRSVRNPTSGPAFRAYLKTELALGEALLRRLQALKPPVSLKPRVDRAVDWQRRFERRVRQLIANLDRSSDPAETVRRAEPSLEALAYQAGAAWRRAGLARCAS